MKISATIKFVQTEPSYSKSQIDSIRCKCKKATPSKGIIAKKDDKNLEININNNSTSNSSTEKKSDSLYKIIKENSSTSKDSVARIDSGWFYLLPILLYFMFTVLQINLVLKKLIPKKTKKNKIIYYLIINFIIGLICILFSYYLFSKIQVNYYFISFLALLLILYALLHQFFKKI